MPISILSCDCGRVYIERSKTNLAPNVVDSKGAKNSASRFYMLCVVRCARCVVVCKNHHPFWQVTKLPAYMYLPIVLLYFVRRIDFKTFLYLFTTIGIGLRFPTYICSEDPINVKQYLSFITFFKTLSTTADSIYLKGENRLKGKKERKRSYFMAYVRVLS